MCINDDKELEFPCNSNDDKELAFPSMKTEEPI
jgi:hypothetical protein